MNRETMSIRPPAVAGAFYESDPARLRAQLAQCYADNPAAGKDEPFIGAVVPHAGLMYSGHVAAALYARLAIPSRLIILCPNHTGAGRAAAVSPDAQWLTPFGPATVDRDLSAEILSRSPLFESDSRAHAREHSLEVQLPFLQQLVPDLRFVPICLATRHYGACEQLGAALADVIDMHRKEGTQIALLASSDLNHYEDQATTLRKDQRAIDRVLALDPRGLWDVVEREGISMCGFIPTTIMLIAALQLGASGAHLIKHATSGDINGDYKAVVGYASIVIS
jgi:AmmeMemoRadiSam system protein B